MNEEQIKKLISDMLDEKLKDLFFSDRYIFNKKIQLLENMNIQVGKNIGSRIGTEITQKLSTYGVTPVVQGSTILDPSGGGTQDAESRTAINALIDRLQDFGIIA